LNKRDMIIVALATFCLTATLFIILPSRSADYTPWGDVSGPTVGESDGTINMRDIQYEIMLFNTNGNTTRNVNVTNWPIDEPLTVKKGTEKISLIDTFGTGTGNGYGVALGHPVWDQSNSWLLYDFEPKGTLLNVSEIYIAYIWRADTAGSLGSPHKIWLTFTNGIPFGGGFQMVELSQGIGLPYDTMPEAESLVVSQEFPSFNFTMVHQGMNSAELSRTDQNNGAHVFVFSLTIYIEYYYLG